MIKYLSLALVILILSGCSTMLGTRKIATPAQNTVAKQEKKVEVVLEKITENEKGKKIQTAALAAGIQHSLNQVTNPPVQVETARTLNERVVSIVGSPHIDEINRIKATVDLLNSEVAEERKKGESLLALRDAEITKLQKEKSELKEKYDDEVENMTKTAEKIATGSDEKQMIINQMSGMFGLNAVFWGIKKFFFSALTFVVVGSVIFIILRLLSTMNPIAGAVFSVFNMVGSVIISLLKALVPKAFEMCNFVSSTSRDKYKGALVKVVDAIQTLREKKEQNSEKSHTLEDVLSCLDREMNDSDKALINEILIEQKWKK